MNEKTPQNSREESHNYGEEALKLFKEAEQLQREADRITDPAAHREAMKPVHAKDLEAIELLRKSNQASLELAEHIRNQNTDLLLDTKTK